MPSRDPDRRTHHRGDVHELTVEQVLPRPKEEVFPFFGDAANLEEITPPSLSFRVLTPLPVEMGEGTLLDYRLRLYGVPFRWRTEITAWEPPHRFVDEQIRGPYRLWVHEHTFTDHPLDGTGGTHRDAASSDERLGTKVSDRVRFAVPLAGWPGAGLVLRRFVRPEVERIFDFRQMKMAQIFGGVAAGPA